MRDYVPHLTILLYNYNCARSCDGGCARLLVAEGGVWPPVASGAAFLSQEGLLGRPQGSVCSRGFSSRCSVNPYTKY